MLRVAGAAVVGGDVSARPANGGRFFGDGGADGFPGLENVFPPKRSGHRRHEAQSDERSGQRSTDASSDKPQRGCEKTDAQQQFERHGGDRRRVLAGLEALCGGCMQASDGAVLGFRTLLIDFRNRSRGQGERVYWTWSKAAGEMEWITGEGRLDAGIGSEPEFDHAVVNCRTRS